MNAPESSCSIAAAASTSRRRSGTNSRAANLSGPKRPGRPLSRRSGHSAVRHAIRRLSRSRSQRCSSSRRTAATDPASSSASSRLSKNRCRRTAPEHQALKAGSSNTRRYRPASEPTAARSTNITRSLLEAAVAPAALLAAWSAVDLPMPGSPRRARHGTSPISSNDRRSGLGANQLLLPSGSATNPSSAKLMDPSREHQKRFHG